MKKILTSLFAIPLCLAVCAGCSDTGTPITGAETVDPYEAANYTILNSLDDTGTSLNFYNHVWQGYDETVGYGLHYGKENRLYTYLTEYSAETKGYALVYLKQSTVAALQPWLETWYQTYESDPSRCHFSAPAEEQIIDGKYLFAYQESATQNDADVKCTLAEDYRNIPFQTEDYQLVFCAQSKKAVIRENVSTKQTINRRISVFHKVILEHDKAESASIKADLTGVSLEESRYGAYLFNYAGERLECYPKEYETIACCYTPLLGLGTKSFSTFRFDVVNADGAKYLQLPRYSGSIDLLDEAATATLSPLRDVFGEYKQQFSEAFVRMADGSDTMGLFDYEKVRNIIH